MSFFGSWTDEALKAPERLVWKTGDIVKFKVLDFNENVQTGDLVVKCLVMNTEHEGKEHKLFISNRQNDAAQKVRRQFALAFWTKEELVSGDAKPAKLMGRLFSSKSRVSPPKTEGQDPYQNWDGFKDLGPDVEPDDGDGHSFATEDGTPRF